MIWNRDGLPVERAHLIRMTDLMEHRGPDGASHRFMGPIALAHRALNTTLESVNEKQPLSNEAAGLCLTFDGRIDNREELKTLLETELSETHSDSDAALVLSAYRKWGEDCPSRLLGDFAFAIWDERRKQLLCARDPLGVRPLFYGTVGKTFVCASEIQALFGLPRLKSEPNLGVLVARLMRESVKFEDTFYSGISRLPFAHCLTITRDAIRQRRYWEIDPKREIRYRNDDEYAEQFRELFFKAVQCRLRSTTPVAAMLSGGVDSSSIVCSAQAIRKQRGITEPKFETFSMAFDRLSKCDERPFINEVVRHCGVRANFHIADRDLEESFFAGRWRLPGLFYTPHAIVLSPVLEAMKAGGFRVLLDGSGGDELAGTFFEHLVALTRRGKLLSVSALIRQYSSLYEIPFWKLALDMAIRPSIPGSVKRLYRRIVPVTSSPIRSLVREEAAPHASERDQVAKSPIIPAFPNSYQREMYAAIFTGAAPSILTETYELNVSYFGIEMRQPFRDRRLLEFAFALPFDQLWRDGWSRFAFRNAMRRTLPDAIRRRRGKGMFLALYDAVLAGSAAAEVRALFEDSVLVRLGVGDAGAIRSLVEEYQRHPSIGSTMKVSDLVGLEITYREILDRAGVIASKREN